MCQLMCNLFISHQDHTIYQQIMQLFMTSLREDVNQQMGQQKDLHHLLFLLPIASLNSVLLGEL